MGATEHRDPPIDARALWDALPDGLVMVEADGRIAAVNPALTEMFGHEPPDLVGRPIEALVVPHQRRDHATVRRRFTAVPRARTMAEGVVFDAYRRDRTTFPVQVALSPIPHGSEQPTLAVIRDVSQRAAAEEALASAHDDSVQRLFGLAMRLRSIAAAADGDTRERLTEVVDGLGTVLDCLTAQQASSRS